MTTISIVHTKGGVGKTTSAMYMATAASRLGLDTAVVDTDPQGSAIEWAKEAVRRGQTLPFEIQSSPRKLYLPDKQMVFVDTPPGSDSVIQEAIESADMVIIPCGASPIDVQRVWPTLELTEGSLSVVVMTAVDLRSNVWSKVRGALRNEKVPVAKTLIPDRASVKKSFGTVPKTFHGYGDLLTELQGVLV